MKQNRRKVGIVRGIAILFAMEVLVFLFAYIAAFIDIASNDGMHEGFRMASGVFYGWFAFVVLGLIAWAVCMLILIFISRDRLPEQQK